MKPVQDYKINNTNIKGENAMEQEDYFEEDEEEEMHYSSHAKSNQRVNFEDPRHVINQQRLVYKY